MAGVKGRSGRKPKVVEYMRLDNGLRSSALIAQFLNDDTIDLEKKIPVATQVYLKTLPDKVEQTNTNTSILKLDAPIIDKLIELAQENRQRRQVISTKTDQNLVTSQKVAP